MGGIDSGRRQVPTTLYPRDASSLAIASPMPELAPVMRTLRNELDKGYENRED